MDDRQSFLSPQDLYSRLCFEGGPIVIDGGPDDGFVAYFAFAQVGRQGAIYQCRNRKNQVGVSLAALNGLDSGADQRGGWRTVHEVTAWPALESSGRPAATRSSQSDVRATELGRESTEATRSQEQEPSH